MSSDLAHYIRYNKVSREDWWVFQWVAWYCKSTKIKLPAGRCHFAEIALIYAPLYLLWGMVFAVLSKTVKMGWVLLKYPTMPFWKPAVWFCKRLPPEFKGDGMNRGTAVFATALIFWICMTGSLILVDQFSSSYNSDDSLLTSLFIAALGFLGPFVLVFLIVWSVEAASTTLKRIYEHGERSSRSLPQIRRVARALVSPVKAVPAGARMSRDFGGALFALAKDAWRSKICQRITYEFDTSDYVN